MRRKWIVNQHILEYSIRLIKMSFPYGFPYWISSQMILILMLRIINGTQFLHTISKKPCPNTSIYIVFAFHPIIWSRPVIHTWSKIYIIIFPPPFVKKRVITLWCRLRFNPKVIPIRYFWPHFSYLLLNLSILINKS